MIKGVGIDAARGICIKVVATFNDETGAVFHYSRLRYSSVNRVIFYEPINKGGKRIYRLSGFTRRLEVSMNKETNL